MYERSKGMENWTIRRFLRHCGRCFYGGLVNTVKHDGIEHAGYLAFLAMLGVFPFLVFFVALAGFLGQSGFGREFVALVIDNIPGEAIQSLKPRIHEIVSGPPQGLITLSIFGTIWTASSTFESSRYALNKAFRVATPPAYIWRRLLSLVQFIVFTLFIIIAMFLIVIAPPLWKKVEQLLGQPGMLDPVWTYVRYGLSAATIFLVVATSYYVLPNIKQRWRVVFPGALMVTVFWILLGMLFASYIGSIRQVNLVYGSLGGIIVALVFFYVLAVVYIFGAEFNYLFERGQGHKIIQKEKVIRPKRRRKTDNPPEDG